MKKITTLLLFLFALSYAHAQDIESYTRLQASGPIPDFFVKFLDEKIADDNDKLREEESITRKNASEFSVITNYRLQQLIQSGKVLYGDPLTNYANGVLDKLKAASDQDLDHIQIYTLKSNEVNAFATHQGVIFITVGLIGQLENEAQLAFILSHELTHVLEKHSQLSYQYSQDLIKKSRYGDGTISDFYQYSRENESEADQAGFELAIKAGYDAEELYNTFRVLLYSYLPIDEQPLDYSQWENESFKIADNYKMDKDRVNDISAEEDVDDEYLTHPNIATRRKGARVFLNNGNSSTNTKKYIHGTSESFENLRTIARFEMLNIYIQRADYVKGLYHSMILLKKYPSNTFLTNSQAMIWYGIAAYETRANYVPYSFSYRKKEGEIQHLYFFLNKLKSDEIVTIATQQVWQKSLTDPENEFLQKLRKEILSEFVTYEENTLNRFAKKPVNIDTVPNKIADDTKLSKYDKIEKKRKREDLDGPLYYALLNVINDDNFIKEIDDAQLKNAKKKETDERVAKANRKPKKSSLDINSIIMTTPNFNEKDDRKSAKATVAKDELTKEKLVGVLEDNANQLGINMSFIDNFKDPNFTTENYNDFSLLNDYLGERLKFDGLDFTPYSAQYTPALTEKYGSQYVGIVGLYTQIERRPFNAAYLLVCAASIYGLPLYFKWQFTKDKSSDYTFAVFNLESNNPSFSNSKFFNGEMSIHLQSAQIYNSLNQITK